MEGKDKGNQDKVKKMTLRDYYKSLPNSSHPKTDLINDVALETGVSAATVRNWFLYGMRPQNRKHIGVLVSKTGIPEDELWED